jgi:flagellar hook-associated protein 3 FlgL
MAGLSMSLKGTPTVGDSVTVTPSPSIFSVLDNAIKDIGNASSANSATQGVSQTLHNIDIGMERVAAVRGQAGDLLNRADRISSNQDKRTIQLNEDRSRAEDMDMIQGISEFNNQQTGYSAALQAYSKVEKLSLFNFIG